MRIAIGLLSARLLEHFFAQRRMPRHSGAIDFEGQIARMLREPAGGTLGIRWIDIALPEVRRLNQVHIGIDNFEAIFGHI